MQLSVKETDVSTITASGQGDGKAGRPTLYTPETVEKLLTSLRAGLTHKQACLACGIGQSTLADWRERYPDLEPRMEAAREIARQTALEGIKKAGEKDWRALAEWLKLIFPEHRPGHNINVSATAVNAQQVVCTEEQRMKLIALRELRAKVVSGTATALNLRRGATFSKRTGSRSI